MSLTLDCLRASVVALSSEEQCAHFKALSSAALTVSDLSARQVQEVGCKRALMLH